MRWPTHCPHEFNAFPGLEERNFVNSSCQHFGFRSTWIMYIIWWRQ